MIPPQWSYAWKVKVLVTQLGLILWPHGLYPARLLCPWNFSGKNTGMGSLSLIQGIFPTQGSNPGLLHCRWILYQLSHREAQLIRALLKERQTGKKKKKIQSKKLKPKTPLLPYQNYAWETITSAAVFLLWSKGPEDNCEGGSCLDFAHILSL